MNVNSFDPIQFYSSYPSKVIARPGYPARAAFKSTLLFNLFGHHLFRKLSNISTYADIGGCFGFGANAMAYHIAKRQRKLPRTFVFEISSDFVKVGKILFPNIEFVEANFLEWNGDVSCFDLISLFDVIEHVVEPELFLRQLSFHTKYLMLKTPMETSGEWSGNRPPVNQGKNHVDGHINFFCPYDYEKLLKESNFDIVEARLIHSILPYGTRAILSPESLESSVNIQEKHETKFFRLKRLLRPYYRFILELPVIPWKWKRKLFGGGDHICLCKSRLPG